MKLTRSLWIHLSPAASIEAVAALVDALKARYPRVEILLTAASPTRRAALARRLPAAIVLAPPLAVGFAVDRRLNRLDVRLLLLAAPGDDLDALLIGRATRRAVPLVALAGWQEGAPAPSGPAALAWQAAELIYAKDDVMGLPPAAAAKTLRPQTADDPWLPLMDALASLLARDLKLARSREGVLRRGFERLLDGVLGSAIARRWLAGRLQRFDSLEALRQALGAPRSILCLGNGPSSEDPTLRELSFDCLFRVNHLWQERGFLTEAQMVFCGSKVTLGRLGETIFGLQTLESERRLLVYLLGRVARGRGARYATLERFALFLTAPAWSHIRPTNGAAMLATAAALQPERLIVSGIDLFTHPAGSYPGDANTPNAYTPGHQPDSELSLLLEALKGYRGELVILSEALQKEWRASKSAGEGWESEPAEHI
jgi:hypothetical protein